MFVLFSIRADFVEIVRDLHVRADSFEKTKSKVGINHFLLSLYLFRYPGPLICEYYLLPPTLPFPSPPPPPPPITLRKNNDNNFPVHVPTSCAAFLTSFFLHTPYTVSTLSCVRLHACLHTYIPTSPLTGAELRGASERRPDGAFRGPRKLQPGRPSGGVLRTHAGEYFGGRHGAVPQGAGCALRLWVSFLGAGGPDPLGKGYLVQRHRNGSECRYLQSSGRHGSSARHGVQIMGRQTLFGFV
jgi:hypothetical protein